MPEMIRKGLLSWATELEDNIIEQAAVTARLPFVEPHVALMPDAHLGSGAAVGAVIPTHGAIIPSAVGVDIGCGMIAVETTIDVEHLPDDLGSLLFKIEARVPAGVGQEHERAWNAYIGSSEYPVRVHGNVKEATTGETVPDETLGSGDPFIELCLDESDHVWVVLHSGSRGVGNKIAKQHIEAAKALMARYFIDLENPDLAYFVEGTAEFDAYIRDLRWAQAFAFANRERMMDLVLGALAEETGIEDVERDRINCHHNYAEMEHHMGKDLWITRKGAIRARESDRGVIPGSMGTASFIVSGLGHPGSFTSASHGAARRTSRGQARREIDPAKFAERMGGSKWLADRAEKLLDEDPDAYKDTYGVMAAQSDLVTIDHELRQVLNLKGA